MHGNVKVVAGLQAAEHFDDDGVAHHERGVRLLTTEALNEPNRLRGRSTAMQLPRSIHGDRSSLKEDTSPSSES